MTNFTSYFFANNFFARGSTKQKAPKCIAAFKFKFPKFWGTLRQVACVKVFYGERDESDLFVCGNQSCFEVVADSEAFLGLLRFLNLGSAL